MVMCLVQRPVAFSSGIAGVMNRRQERPRKRRKRMNKIIKSLVALSVAMVIAFSSSVEAQAAKKSTSAEMSESIKTESISYDATEIFEKASPAIVELKITDSYEQVYIGSGFFVGKYNILTNEHVIHNASKIEVYGIDGKEYTLTSIYKMDEKVDLAVLRVKEKNTQYLTFAEEESKVGDTIYAIGSPVGVTGAFLKGMVSAEKRIFNEVSYVQLDIASGKGLGGAPVLNDRGEVEGVMCLTVPSANCINMAIKLENIKPFLADMKKSDRVSLAKFYKRNINGVVEPNSINLFDSASYSYTSDSFEGVYEELTPEEIYNESVTAMAQVYGFVSVFGGFLNTSSGAGFFIDENTVVTCAHVVKDYNTDMILIVDYKGNTYDVERVVAGEGDCDVAVLRVKLRETSKEGADFVPGTLRLGRDYIPASGEEVYALGDPRGYIGTMSQGNIMVPNVVIGGVDYMMHSAATSPGNSGGALLNRYGQVIAVTNMLITTSEKMCLAVNIDNISKLLKEARQ